MVLQRQAVVEVAARVEEERRLLDLRAAGAEGDVLVLHPDRIGRAAVLDGDVGLEQADRLEGRGRLDLDVQFPEERAVEVDLDEVRWTVEIVGEQADERPAARSCAARRTGGCTDRVTVLSSICSIFCSRKASFTPMGGCCGIGAGVRAGASRRVRASRQVRASRRVSGVSARWRASGARCGRPGRCVRASRRVRAFRVRAWAARDRRSRGW